MPRAVRTNTKINRFMLLGEWSVFVRKRNEKIQCVGKCDASGVAAYCSYSYHCQSARIQNGPRKSSRLPFCTCPCYCINFCIYAMPRTEINTVARTRTKRKAGYFFVVHPVYYFSSHPLPKHQTINQTHVTSKMSRYRSPLTSISSMFNSTSSFTLILPFIYQSTILSSIIKTHWLDAYSEYKILRNTDMWKVRLLPLLASRTLHGCLAGFSHQGHKQSFPRTHVP